ncbi:unnamed protein product [Rhodiola kirilowii]
MSSLELPDGATADCNLPKDIILDILSRLPVRSLIRFRCVCKSWAALTLNPNFITKHHNRATEQLIVHTKRSFDSKHHAVTMILRTNKKRNDGIDMELPPPCDTNNNYVRLVGSCNGLVCISMCSTGSIVLLWNPATREFRNLPVRQVLVPNGRRIHAMFISFGFEPKTSDYKIVRFLSYKKYDSNVPRVGVVEVYSKVNDMWKEVTNPGLKCVVNEYSPSAFVSGVIHWLGTRLDKGKNRVDGKDVIVCFDLGREVFGDMLLPESSVYADEYGWQISVVRDSLSLLAFPICRGNMSKSIDVWVMKEYGVAESWIKQSSIRLFSGVSRPVGCFKNGELILQNNKDKLFLYNPVTKKFGTLPLCSAKYVYDVHSYAESLVSVRVGN